MPVEGAGRGQEEGEGRAGGLQGGSGATCAWRKSSPHGTALSLVSAHGDRIPQRFCVPCGGKMTVVELTRGEEEVIKISEAHTFSTGLHSEIFLPNSQATSILKPLGSSLCWGVQWLIRLWELSWLGMSGSCVPAVEQKQG